MRGWSLPLLILLAGCLEAPAPGSPSPRGTEAGWLPHSVVAGETELVLFHPERVYEAEELLLKKDPRNCILFQVMGPTWAANETQAHVRFEWDVAATGIYSLSVRAERYSSAHAPAREDRGFTSGTSPLVLSLSPFRIGGAGQFTVAVSPEQPVAWDAKIKATWSIPIDGGPWQQTTTHCQL